VIEDDSESGPGRASFSEPGFAFAQLEIGGRDAEFETPFPRALNSRLSPLKVIPDTGPSTWRGSRRAAPTARQIGKMLKIVEP